MAIYMMLITTYVQVSQNVDGMLNILSRKNWSHANLNDVQPSMYIGWQVECFD